MDRFIPSSPLVPPPLSLEGVYHAIVPENWRFPLLLASPHSGRDYPLSFLESSRLDNHTIRKSEDSFVEQLYADAPSLGAPLLTALFPRAFLDVNREAYELDPAMFKEPLPDYVNSTSPRVQGGLGTVARFVTGGEPIYHRKLSFAEAQWRINHFYYPYHEILQWLIQETKNRFGYCLLIDCHSMPSSNPIAGTERRFIIRHDFVLGDCHHRSCARKLLQTSYELLRRKGYRISINDPYAGGFTTAHYGSPEQGVHALQIEINRALYMDEDMIEPHKGMDPLRQTLNSLIALLGTLEAGFFL